MTGTDNRVNRKLLLEYDQKKKLYDDFLVMILRFLGEFIKGNSLGVFSFEGVVMSHQELEAKLKSGLVASCIEDVDDFVQVEILTYFEDDVLAVSNILDTEFKIIEGAINQKAGQDPQHFGYHAPSYLVRMVDSRLEWIEYRCFKDCKVKVNVSSLLQNTWGKIQNRLNIDKSSVPYHQLRPAQRVAGLFELADRELNQLKNSLPQVKEVAVEPVRNVVVAPIPREPVVNKPNIAARKEKVAKVKPGVLALSLRNTLSDLEQSMPELVLTTETVGKLILDDPDVRRVDRLISDGFSTRLKFDTIFLENLCDIANQFHITNKNTLLNFINQQEQKIYLHAQNLITKPVGDAPFTVPRGISILMAFHVLAKDGKDKEAIDNIASIIHSF
jgi:ppGpp synthetase/RelA/SpoT-type nucleotidyltranferase